ncbi:protein LURP-one-related 5-like [Mangifera indica]|uniref:protein LURP-one-related 5-like n=1 Tax=Mangifera indica TaxID=29780 RepID=UPI001CFC31A3|nr:protein LURP-one-related 5-like [Mangifera indica]
MSKVYPTENKHNDLIMSKGKVLEEEEDDVHERRRPSILTVWKRSSMSFQGTDGFTVFDHYGRLVFRVDNYSRSKASGLVLMDGAGNCLLSLKPQMLSLQYQWNAYREEEGDDHGKRSRVFSMMRRSPVFFNNGKDEAEVYMGRNNKQAQLNKPDFTIEGSFRTRNCKIKNANGEVVASIARKRVNSTILLSDDVFSLVVQPGFPTHLVMAFVIILDRICSKIFAPVLCS